VRGRGGRPSSSGSRHGACRRVGQDPNDRLLQGIRRRGPSPLPTQLFWACSGPDHRSTLGSCSGAYSGEGCRPVADVRGGASRTEEPEDVILGAEERWRWGLPRELQIELKPLLDAVRRLWDRDLTATGVVAKFHRRRVLPLTDRRLRLDEMMAEAFVESSRMASTALSTEELLRQVKGTAGKADYSAIVPMRLEQGYVSLVRLLFLPVFWTFPLLLSSYPSVGVVRLSDRPTLGSGRHNRQGGASASSRGEEEEG
jgi:hypothetical protein